MKLADTHIHRKVMKLPAGYGDFSGAAVNGGTGGGNPRFDGEFYAFLQKILDRPRFVRYNSL